MRSKLGQLGKGGHRGALCQAKDPMISLILCAAEGF